MNGEQFLSAASSFPRESVEVPGVGPVSVRVMSAGDRDRFESHIASSAEDFRARLVQATACDDSGALLFTAADVPRLSALPASSLQPIADVAVRLNKLRASDFEADRKNSEAAPA